MLVPLLGQTPALLTSGRGFPAERLAQGLYAH